MAWVLQAVFPEAVEVAEAEAVEEQDRNWGVRNEKWEVRNMEKIKKFFGWVLLLLGLTALGYSLVEVFYLKRPVSQWLSPISSKPIPKKTILSLAVIGDPESDLPSLEKGLAKIKDLKLNPVILVGDLTQTGTPQQLEAVKKVLDQSQLLYFVIPGNHDLWYQREVKDNPFFQYFGQGYSATESASIKLIMLNNADEWHSMGQTQLNWLDKQFGHVTMQPLIFLHIPLYHPESQYIMGFRDPQVKKEGEALLKLFCSQPPLAIISGHLHHTNDYEYTCPDGQKLRMLGAGSLNSKRNWQLPRFLRIEILEDMSLKIEEIEIQ